VIKDVLKSRSSCLKYWWWGKSSCYALLSSYPKIEWRPQY